MPFNYGKHYISNKDIQSVIKVLKSDWLTQGPYIRKFEKNLNKYFGGKYCSVVSNGTSALFLTGLALGWRPGDIIITTPITFLATVNSIEYQGATPDFVDINAINYNIDLNKLEEKIIKYKKENKKIKAVIAVDFAGHPCDWKSLRYLANKFNFKLINDNCHALGATYFKSKKYSTKYADVVTQSFHPVKNITTGEGGAILTNDKKFYEKVKILRTHGITKNKKNLLKNDGGWYYEMHELGYNFRISDFQCALGISQLNRLDFFIKKRRDIAKKYNNYFSKNEKLQIPYVEKNVEHAFHLYPLLIDFDSLNISKKQYYNLLKKNGINLNVHFIPIHTQPYYKKKYGFRNKDYINSLNFYKNTFSLPIYPQLKSFETSYIAKIIINNLI